MPTMALAWRLARRELRGGLRGFRIFIACLALGVAVIAGAGALSAAVGAGLRADARAMLGGDVELHLVHRPATPQQRAYLAKDADVSEVAQMRAMARTEDGNERALVELKAVDGAYPLYGAVTLDPAQMLDAAIAKRDGHWGAVVAPGLLTRLKLHLGDPVRVGDATFILRAVLTHEPDAATGGFEFGPRVMVATAALAETGLLAPGALVGYGYRLRLPPDTDTSAWIAAVKSAFPDAGWRIREFANAAPNLQRLIGRVTVFMTLVGLTALLLAAVFGLLTTLAFALWPLAAAREVSAASLFRDLVDPAPRRPRLGYVLATAAAALALAGLGIVAAGIVLAARRAGRPRAPRLRLALANLYRPGAPTAGIVASLGLGLTVLVAIALIERNIDSTIDERLPEQAPSFFFIDIQPDQVAEFDKLVAATPGVTQFARVASLRGRITQLNGVPVEKAVVAPEAQWTIQSERGLTYAATPPRGSRIVAGHWWPADYHGPPLVSMDAEIARGMALKLGDTITVNVLGRDVTATIANLREIDWTSLGINFVLVFSPGMLEAAPQTHIATARTPPGEEAALERAVTDRFPNVSAIAVKDALAALGEIVSAIGTALRATAAITLAAGTLVLAGAVAAGQRRRVYEAVVLKVLGATRSDVTRAFLIEYGILGLTTAAIAATLGTFAAYLVLTRVMHQDWTFMPGALVSTALIATALTLGIGYAGTWKALGAKAAPFLRNE